MNTQPHEDRVLGLLLGTAVGDALGLPFEGMNARKVRLAFRIDRPHYIGWGRATVSDDTEQSALLAQALTQRATGADVVRAFRRSMIGWFLRLPFGIGLGTAVTRHEPAPRWSPLRALLRNLSLFPLIVVHGMSRGVRW